MCLVRSGANEVVLSSGLENWSRRQLDLQFNAFAQYKHMRVISASSILVYRLDEDGNLDTYKTNDSSVNAEDFQLSVRQKIGLKAYPCLFCDATVGFCSQLNTRLERMYQHKIGFFSNVTARVLMNGWNGFAVDFEPDEGINWARLSDFLVELSNVLRDLAQVVLYVWVGGRTLYTESVFSAPNIVVWSMNTYVDTYNHFVDVAAQDLALVDNTTRLGFGLLQSNDVPEWDMINVVSWMRVAKVPMLNLWASNISGFALKALETFLL